MKISRNTYKVMLFMVGGWCAAIVAAPLSRLFGFPSFVPSFLYEVFSHVCHQFPDRSLNLAGEPLAVCARCSAIYVSFMISLSLFSVVRGLENTAPPPRIYLLLALAPMALDVLLSFTGVLPSTMGSRMVTGVLAGSALPWYVFPPMLEAARTMFVHRELHVRETQ